MDEKSLNKNGFTYPKNSVGKSILWALYPIGVDIVAAIIVAIVFAFVIAFKIVLSGQEFIVEDVENIMYSNIGLTLIIPQVISLAAILPIYLIYRKYQPKPEKKNTAGSVALGVLFALGFCAVVSILQNLFFSLFSVNDALWEQTQAMLVSLPFGVQIISTVILAPILEELMFRGMIMNRLMSVFPKWVGVVASALVFGVIHLNITQGIFATLTGIVFGVLYVKTRSLWLCIFAHAANNLWATALSQVEWSSDIYAFLAEAGLAVVTLSIVFAAWLVKRNKTASYATEE